MNIILLIKELHDINNNDEIIIITIITIITIIKYYSNALILLTTKSFIF
jgi:uncharacterized membrane protein YhaH (DUF805 family)